MCAKFKLYFLKNSKGQGIYNCQGNLYYLNMNKLDSLFEVTSFDSKKDIIEFAKKRKIEYDSIGTIEFFVKELKPC